MRTTYTFGGPVSAAPSTGRVTATYDPGPPRSRLANIRTVRTNMIYDGDTNGRTDVPTIIEAPDGEAG